MNNKILFVVALSYLLIGCATVNTMEGSTCTVISIDSECDGDRHYPAVTLNTQDATLDVHPSNVCANNESTIIFRVVPPGLNEVGSVSIVAKDSTNTWLIGSNSPDKKEIAIFVPDWVAADEEYDYSIYLADGRCVDPRVSVEN